MSKFDDMKLLCIEEGFATNETEVSVLAHIYFFELRTTLEGAEGDSWEISNYNFLHWHVPEFLIISGVAPNRPRKLRRFNRHLINIYAPEQLMNQLTGSHIIA